MAIVALTPRQWKDLTSIIGKPEMATDSKFENIIVQIKNHSEAVSLIEEWTEKKTSEEIIEILQRKKTPCGIAYTSWEINHDSNLQMRQMFQKIEHPQFGAIDIPGFPFKLSECEMSIRMPAPTLGEHTRIILEKKLGYTSQQIEELYRDKVVV